MVCLEGSIRISLSSFTAQFLEGLRKIMLCSILLFMLPFGSLVTAPRPGVVEA